MLCERPFFDIICHRKTPTSERCLVAWLSYVTFICEFPPPRGLTSPKSVWKFSVHKLPNLEIFGSQARSLSLSEVGLSISSQAPPFGNPGRTPLPEKKVEFPPPPDLYTCSGQYTIRALIAVALQVELKHPRKPRNLEIRHIINYS